MKENAGPSTTVASTTSAQDDYLLITQSQPKKTRWAWTVATFFGAGLGKPGPGTWGSVGGGSAVGRGGVWLHPSPAVLLLILVAGIGLSISLGVPAATIAARESGRHDPGFVVIDEVAGQWIALLFCPADWRHGAHRAGPLPALRHHQAFPGAPAREPAGGLGHRLRRCGRRAVCFGYSVACCASGSDLMAANSQPNPQ